MSVEQSKLMAFMILELSTMKYTYRSIIEGCYEAAITNYGYKKPSESKNVIVDEVIGMLNNPKGK